MTDGRKYFRDCADRLNTWNSATKLKKKCMCSDNIFMITSQVDNIMYLLISLDLDYSAEIFCRFLDWQNLCHRTLTEISLTQSKNWYHYVLTLLSWNKFCQVCSVENRIPVIDRILEILKNLTSYPGVEDWEFWSLEYSPEICARV